MAMTTPAVVMKAALLSRTQIRRFKSVSSLTTESKMVRQRVMSWPEKPNSARSAAGARPCSTSSDR